MDVPSHPADLLDAVLARPDDDQARLGYAASLGEDPRAELIRAQVARHQLEEQQRTATLEYREAFLRDRNLVAAFEKPAPPQKGPDRPKGTFTTYARGFLERIEVETFADLPDLSCEPLREIVFRAPPLLEELRTLAPLARRLETITVAADDAAVALDARVALPALEEASASGPSFDPTVGLPPQILHQAITGLRSSVGSEEMLARLVPAKTPRLRRLRLSAGYYQTAFEAFARTLRFGRLDRIELRGYAESGERLMLEHAEAATRLALHDWLGDRLGARFVPWLARCRALPRLRELRTTLVHDGGLVRLLDSLAGELDSLVVRNGFLDDGLEELAKSQLVRRLRRLDVRVRGDRRPFAMLPFERLTHLALENFELEMDFLTAPELATVVELELNRCKMPRSVVVAIEARFPVVRWETRDVYYGG